MRLAFLPASAVLGLIDGLRKYLTRFLYRIVESLAHIHA